MAARCQSADSTTAAAWEAALAGRLADAVITDPPYCLLTRRRKGGDEREPKGRKLERGPLRRFEDVRAYRDFTRAWLSLARLHCTPAAPLVVWTNLLGREPLLTVAGELGWTTLRGEYVWAKRTRAANSGEELARVVETALVFTRSPAPRPAPEDPAVPWAAVTPHAEAFQAVVWHLLVSHPALQSRGMKWESTR